MLLNSSSTPMVSIDLTLNDLALCRFSLQEFKKFCNLPIKEAAIALAESGKIGALNLLFKRHPYSLTSSLLDVFAAIPETLPVQTYGQLLPGSSPPPSISLREEDWVECDEMVTFIISRVMRAMLRSELNQLSNNFWGLNGLQEVNSCLGTKRELEILIP